MIEHFNVSGALLSKLFGNPDRDADFFKKRALRVHDIYLIQSTFNRFFFVSLSLTASIATAIVYGWGGVLSVRGVLDVGTVVALTAYLARLFGPLTSLSNFQVDIMTSLVSFERIFEVLDLAPLINEKSNAVVIPPGAARIQFDHVRFSYPSAKDVSLASLESVAILEQIIENQVLFDISFSAKPGQMVALVGHSGAGKTTIAQLLGRLYDVDSGSIRVNGVDLRDATLDSVRDRIGIVTQDSHMFHDTIRNNLLYAKPDATEAELEKALEDAQILPLIRSFPKGLDTTVGERGYRLSGGEKQRLAIARVLLKAPDIIILDEATAHLDSESEQAIQLALTTALYGRTSLVIAHRLSTIQKADLILVIENGRIAESGVHAELLASGGLYAELYDAQFAKTFA
jgi:ATP-binding cassette subfamily B protein